MHLCGSAISGEQSISHFMRKRERPLWSGGGRKISIYCTLHDTRHSTKCGDRFSVYFFRRAAGSFVMLQSICTTCFIESGFSCPSFAEGKHKKRQT